MSKLVEATHVTLGGEIGPTNAWARPYLDDQHSHDATQLLTDAEALLLGRVTYEGLSAAYTKMAEQAPPGVPTDFIDRMNRIPKFVASSTLQPTAWNASHIEGDVLTFVENLKRSGKNLLKYGNGPLDASLMEQRLIDEFHLFLTPVAAGAGQHLFESIRVCATSSPRGRHAIRQRRDRSRLHPEIARRRAAIRLAPRAPATPSMVALQQRNAAADRGDRRRPHREYADIPGPKSPYPQTAPALLGISSGSAQYLLCRRRHRR